MTDVNSLVPESIRDEIANCINMRDESDRVKFLNMLPAPSGALGAAEGFYLLDGKAISFSGVVDRDGHLVLHHWHGDGKALGDFLMTEQESALLQSMFDDTSGIICAMNLPNHRGLAEVFLFCEDRSVNVEVENTPASVMGVVKSFIEERQQELDGIRSSARRVAETLGISFDDL